MTATQTDTNDTTDRTADKLAEMLTENTGRSFWIRADTTAETGNATKGPTLKRSLKGAWNSGFSGASGTGKPTLWRPSTSTIS